MSHHIASDAALSAALAAVPPTTLVVVDVFAEWCGPCKAVAPAYEALAQRFDGARFLKVNGDTVGAARTLWAVRGYPTFVLLRGGAELDRVVGADAAALERAIERHLRVPEPVSPFSAFPAPRCVAVVERSNPEAAAKLLAIDAALVMRAPEQPGVALAPLARVLQDANASDKHFAAVDLVRQLLASERGADAVALMHGTALDVWEPIEKWALAGVPADSPKALVNRHSLAWECVANALCYAKSRRICLDRLLAHLEQQDLVQAADARFATALATVLLNLSVIAFGTRDERVHSVATGAVLRAHAAGVAHVRLLGAIGTLFWCSYVQRESWDVTNAMLLSSLPLADDPATGVVVQLRRAFELPLQ